VECTKVFVLGKPSQPVLIFGGRVALLANIKLISKGLQETNT